MTFDLHANISRRMVANTDATIVRLQPAPGSKGARFGGREIMSRTLRGEIHPVQAMENLPMLINMSKQ